MMRMPDIGKKRIGLFGGTFNPIHWGHVKAAESVQQIFSLDRILFIPSYIPPHKGSADVASAAHRLKMVELALAPFEDFLPSSLEIGEKGTSYSIVTLNKIKRMFPQTEVFFLLGIDAFLEIETWKDYEDVLEQCSFIVMSRPGFRLDEAKEILPGKYTRRMVEVSGSFDLDSERSSDHAIYLLSIKTLDVSSSEVRERIKTGRPVEGLVPESVKNYIKEKRLYLHKIMDAKNEKKAKTKHIPEGVKISVEASRSKKAEDILVLDLTGISSFTDFFIIMHGNSSRQNVAIFESVEEHLKAVAIRPLSIEGKENAEWILMDYGEFIVHIFSSRAREYYALEKLWGDGIKLSL
jgi:nicotinate (nicotinamide) nucleotide adenylyltransferase/ribosome silencing factor RsfS/YbeB/iojap